MSPAPARHFIFLTYGFSLEGGYHDSHFTDGLLRFMGYVSGLESTSLQGTELGLERWPLGSARKLPCSSPVSLDLPWDQAWDTMGP